MTSGERMVWAAAFQSHFRDSDSNWAAAACWAAAVVGGMRALGRDGSQLTETERAMLDDMLSNGGDR